MRARMCVCVCVCVCVSKKNKIKRKNMIRKDIVDKKMCAIKKPNN